MLGLRLLLPLLMVTLASVSAQTPAGAVPPTQKKNHSGTSPFSAFTKSLDQAKRKPFMELMKKLRDAKKATGTKEEKKKTTTSLDVDIHKLLGVDYKRYRAVQGAVNALHASKKSTTDTGAAASSPPPPPVIMKSLSGAKKKKKTTKGSSTTI